MADLRPFRPGERRDNPDGSYSTEITTTWQLPDGSWTNVPSLWMGSDGPVQFDTGDEHNILGAMQAYEAQNGQTFPRFRSLAEAERYARSRSAHGGAAAGAADLDLGRVKRNVKKMVDMGAPETDIDAYISSEGTTIDAVKTFREQPESQQSQDLRAELSAMTQNPAKAKYDALPGWQKPIVAAKDMLDLGVNGITMGFGDKAVAAARAPFTDKTYEEELAAQRGLTQGARNRAGSAGLAAEVGGAVATPMALAGKGVTLAGRFGTGAMTGLPGLAARTGLMAAEGAGYGALTAAGNDRDIGEGALIGAAGGAAGNLLGEGISKGVHKVAGAFNKAPPRMTAEELKAASREAYKAAEDAGVIFTPKGVQQLQRGIVDDFTNHGFHPTNEPGAATVLRELRKLSDKNVTLKGLDNIRKIASNGFQPGNQSNNALLTQTIKRIDDFVENAGGDAVMMGSNSKEAGKLIANARKLWGRASKLERAEQLLDKAGRRAASTGSGGNVENATRQNINRMLDNPRLSRGMTPDELAAARKAVVGTPTQNALRLAGKLSPQGNGLMTYLMGAGSIANPVVGIPAMIAGYGSKKASEMLAQRSVDELVNLIAQGGNAASLKTVENTVQLLSKAKREALSRALMAIGVNRTVGAGNQPAN